MKPLFDMLTDEEVKLFSTELNNIDNVQEKIKYVFSKTGFDGVGREYERTIKKRVYKYGISFNWETKYALSKCYFETDRNKWFNDRKSDFSIRLKNCESEKQSQNLIKEEMQFLAENIDRCKKSYERLQELISEHKHPHDPGLSEELSRISNSAATYKGYLSEARKTYPVCETLEEVQHPPTGSFTTGNGAAIYLMKEEFLPSLLLHGIDDDETQDLNDATGLLYPNKTAHKMLILEKLGILELIKEQYRNSDNKNLARLIAIILNEKTEESIETIRKGLSDISKLKNNTSNNKVDTILSQFNGTNKKK